MKRFLLFLATVALLWAPLSCHSASPTVFTFNKEVDTLKLLTIGNSFSDDAVEQHLSGLFEAAGIPIVIGNAYIGGCSLERHHNNAKSGKAEYSYRKIAHGVKTESPNRSLESILRDEPWTLVSLQQASAYSGVYESFEPYLTELITYVRGFLSKAQLAWHQTWAYDEGSWHDAFSTYGSSQDKMYKAILACTQMIAQNPHFDGIVPCGTAIQNARGTEVKDRLTRDTYHLSFDCGRYVASCTWFEALTGNSSVGNSYKPEALTPGEARTCQECAHLAILNPYKVSPLE